MPSIIAVPYPTRGQTLLEVNFADVPGATNVHVEAVTGLGTTSEARRDLHPYISYNTNGYQTLSCGQAVFWDTEISCNTATVYCATAINAAGSIITKPAPNLVTDTFTRTVANGWGSTDNSLAWTVTGGAAADYSVTGTRGQHAIASTAVNRVSAVTVNAPNLNAMVTCYPAAVALTQATEQWLMLRADTAGNNGYKARLRFNTAGTVDLILERVVAGVATSLGTSLGFATYTATSGFGIEFQAWGSQLNVRAWDITTPEPSTYMVTATDATFTAAGTVDLVSLRNAGNTNGTINMQFDNLTVTDVCNTLVNVTECTSAVTIACDGCFRLGDPVRPCNDVKICLCANTTACGATGGLAFVGETAEVEANNSGSMLPVNSRWPIFTTRTRMASSGEIDVVATSFTARDSLLALLQAGGALFWRGPSDYGLPDRYIQVLDVSKIPQIADLTIQPRMVTLPFQEVMSPVGPTQGVCGARITDLCQVYTSWNSLVAAGLTYADLLRGEASTTPSGLATWNIINAQNASWNVLLVNEPDWNDVVDGD